MSILEDMDHGDIIKAQMQRVDDQAKTTVAVSQLGVILSYTVLKKLLGFFALSFF